jgi:Protein of unknown function (DUF3017)
VKHSALKNPAVKHSAVKHPAVKHSAVKHSAKAAARRAREQDAADRRPAAPDAGGPRLLTQLPYLLVLAGMAAGLATIRSSEQAVRGGTLVIAGALLAGSLIRLVLPAGRAGMLGSRRRLADVAALAVLGLGLLIAGLLARVSG